jgi:hypothetical protein
MGGVVQRSLVMLALGAVLVTAAPGAPGADAAASSAAACADVVRQYGHITGLSRKGGRFELRFDPAWWLTGVAAERAAAADGAIRPGEPVPNDYYIVDEGHRVLTYPVPATARVTVITRAVRPAAITVAELAQIARGRNPRHRPLLEPKAGFWIRIAGGYPGTVLSLDQQYQP